jgi:pimeloyl-ACP methyl ester carboxylesterase
MLFHSSCCMAGQVCALLFSSVVTKNVYKPYILGSFLEFLPILSLMKDKYTPQKLPYHIVVPSLPGYGFSSSPPLDRDFSMNDIGALINQLMIDLGFGEGYIAQGGDIGSRVAKILAWDYEACKGKSPSLDSHVKQILRAD